MSLVDSRSTFGWISIVQHWVIAALILVLIAVGLIIANMPDGPTKGSLIGLHKMTGVAALALALVRILWGQTQTQPGAIEGSPAIFVWARKAMHVSLLVFSVLIPLSGVLMSLFFNHPVNILGLFTIPAQGEVLWIAMPAHFVHEWGSYALLALIAGHALVSLKHHFMDHDATLRRMLSPTAG